MQTCHFKQMTLFMLLHIPVVTNTLRCIQVQKDRHPYTIVVIVIYSNSFLNIVKLAKM